MTLKEDRTQKNRIVLVIYDRSMGGFMEFSKDRKSFLQKEERGVHWKKVKQRHLPCKLEGNMKKHMRCAVKEKSLRATKKERTGKNWSPREHQIEGNDRRLAEGPCDLTVYK